MWADERRNLLRYQLGSQKQSSEDGGGDGDGLRGPAPSPAQIGNEWFAPAPTPSPLPPLPLAPPPPPRPCGSSPGRGSEGHEAGHVEYYGGPVLSDPLTVYLIFYGNWMERADQEVFEQFVRGLSNRSADAQVTARTEQEPACSC